MALIICPKCGKQFSDRAEKCPQCGTSQKEVQRLLAEKEAEEAAERERLRQELEAQKAEEERLRKEREAKEAEEARIRAEQRAEWWRRNRKIIWRIVTAIAFIVLLTIAIYNIKGVMEQKRIKHNIEVAIAQGDSCVHICAFNEAKAYYNKALEHTNNPDTRNRIMQKFKEINAIKCEAAIASGDSCVRVNAFDKAVSYYDKALNYNNDKEVKRRVWAKLQELNIKQAQFNKKHAGSAKSKKVFEMKNIYISLPIEMEDFLKDLGISNSNFSNDNHFYFGNVMYGSNAQITPATDVRPYDEEYEEIECFPFDKLGNNRSYIITSDEYDGFQLSITSDNAEDGIVYKEIILIHPLNKSPYDSIVCTNIKFEQTEYTYHVAKRPCSGHVRVFRVDGNDIYVSKEMLAIDSRTIWKEYDANGKLKSEKEIKKRE